MQCFNMLTASDLKSVIYLAILCQLLVVLPQIFFLNFLGDIAKWKIPENMSFVLSFILWVEQIKFWQWNTWHERQFLCIFGLQRRSFVLSLAVVMLCFLTCKSLGNICCWTEILNFLNENNRPRGCTLHIKDTASGVRMIAIVSESGHAGAKCV